ncbi:A disintegrin and metallo ase with thrombospondin motifs 19 [Brachionus plicatilis]|uniref:A disintegrin and metallo ase with thrombospondin motifs 19 n=1 Tax=Brachionus plicatilis TaxID=10195 RepID=A0A3M7RSL3_BRAPC|nr:A disintegrin and metallo ase with thrombospondin motifs 19 [Brachionus plicatilis]
MFIIIYLQIVFIQSALSKNHSDTDLVHDLEISNVKFGSLRDIFPVYFSLKFSTFNYKYDISFYQTSSTDSRLSKYGKFCRVYQSFRIKVTKLISKRESRSQYTADCVLILSPASYSSLVSKNEIHLEKKFSKMVLINLHVKKKQPDAGELWIGLEVDSEIMEKYKAVRFKINSNLGPRKRQNTANYTLKNGKTYLNVESCLLIDFRVYEMFRLLLNADPYYVKMYLDVRFARVMTVINKIYETFSNSWFEITVEFNQLKVLTELQPILERAYKLRKDPSDLMFKVKDQIVVQKWLNLDECDHVFFIHQFDFAEVIGSAFLTYICNNHLKVSLANIDISHSMEVVMAHELGHNLGASHDNTTYCPEYHLMYPAASSSENSFKASQCTINFLKKGLFTESRILKKEFSCLVETNTNKSVVPALPMRNMPGLMFSKTEQCRFYMKTWETFACKRDRGSICSSLKCYDPVKRDCVSQSGWQFEGTPCDKDKICFNQMCHSMNERLRVIKIDANPTLVLMEREKNERLAFLEKSINNAALACPEGFSTETLAFKKWFYLIKNKIFFTCDQMMYINPNTIESETKLILSSICCEKYRKWTFFKCPRNGHCKYPTCEQFTSNPCFNNGKCVNVKSMLNATEIEFHCLCPSGFQGKLLRLSIFGLN